MGAPLFIRVWGIGLAVVVSGIIANRNRMENHGGTSSFTDTILRSFGNEVPLMRELGVWEYLAIPNLCTLGDGPFAHFARPIRALICTLGRNWRVMDCRSANRPHVSSQTLSLGTIMIVVPRIARELRWIIRCDTRNREIIVKHK
ncbi:hypothetical protein HOY80DRAFT_413537 [Tuber brumale]|nr:hypothetical protein HOY80DRAFT_413537 [Tuber brumale]